MEPIYILIFILIICIYIILILSINYINTRNLNDMLISHYNDINDVINMADSKLHEIEKIGLYDTNDELHFMFMEVVNIQTILNEINGNNKSE